MRSIFVLLVIGSTALGDPTPQQQATAVALFNDAKQLMKDGKVADACKKFEASRNLYATVGTRLNLADCYSKLGRVFSAWAEFRETMLLAQKSNDPQRAEFAKQQMALLEPRLSHLTINVAAQTPGLAIKTDDQALDTAAVGTALPIDPGEHVISASADGYDPWSQKITFTEKQSQTVSVPALVKSKVVTIVNNQNQNPKVTPTKSAGSGSNGRRTASIVVLGIGAAAVATGLVFGGLTMSKWSTVKNDCPNDLCTNQTDVDAANTAATFGNISTFAVAGGLALVATGAILLATTPKRHVEVSAVVGPVNGFVVAGRF
jgi:hypothetical protein